MKLRFLACLALLLLGVFGTTQAASITVDHVDGMVGPASDSIIQTGAPVKFYIRLTGDENGYGGITNGFRLYSPEGATWDTTLAANDLDADLKMVFDLVWSIARRSTDGAGADTIGFSGAAGMNFDGMWAGYNGIPYSLTVGPIDAAYNGNRLCIDSAFYPPSGKWKWATTASVPVTPDWGGPYCFWIGDKPQPKNLVVGTDTLRFEAAPCMPLPAAQTFTVSEQGGSAIAFTATEGTSWMSINPAGGSTPQDVSVSIVSLAGLAPSTYYYGTVTVASAEATNSPVTKVVELYVGEPEITQVDPDHAKRGTQNLVVEITGAYVDFTQGSSVTARMERDGGNVIMAKSVSVISPTEIEATFDIPCDVPEEEDYDVVVTYNAGGCTVLEENVFMIEPADGGRVFASATSFPFDMAVGGGNPAPASVTFTTDAPCPFMAYVEEDASWLTVDKAQIMTDGADALAISVDGTGLAAGVYKDSVYLTGGYIMDAPFAVEVVLTVHAIPAIDCPIEALAAQVCESADSVAVALAITDADEVSVDGGVYDIPTQTLRFAEAGSGDYNFSITATNAWGSDNCDLTVALTVLPLPGIECPTGPITVTVGETGAQYCYPMILTNTASVEVQHGYADFSIYWNNNELCFDIDALGTFNVKVVATNDCGSTECDVVINVVDCPMAEIDCPTEPLNFELCELALIEIPIEVANYVSVETPDGGSWDNGVFSFTPASAGAFEFSIVATNACGPTTCDFTVNVSLTPDVVMDCPVDPVYYSACGPGTFTLGLVIENADYVLVDNGSWADDVLTFDIAAVGTFPVVVTAGNDCDDASCSFDVIVTFTAPPVACFTADPVEGPVPLEVEFTNCSEGETQLEYFWNFGDGDTSGDENPSHTYDMMGKFHVQLDVTDECDNTDTYHMYIMVTDNQIVVPTDKWIVVACEGGSTMEGEPLNEGDIITAYDPDGILCGMGVVDEMGGFNFNVYHDDIYTTEVDEGADDGELITFRINGTVVASDPVVTWTTNGDTHVVCSFTSETCMTYTLNAGWNLISWNVAYTDAVEDFIAEYADCVDVVLGFNQGGMTYDPLLPQFSTLHTVDFYHGYWLRLSCDVEFELCGGMISPTDGIEVYTGWNLVSYWPEETLPVEGALASLMDDDNVLVAYGFDNGVFDYVPGDPDHNTLTEMSPMFGYWVKVGHDDMLDYWGSIPKSQRYTSPGPLAKAAGVKTSPQWMNIYGENITLDGERVADGSTIEVFSQAGELVGRGTVNSGLLQFTPVYGESVGEALSIRVDGRAVSQELTWSGMGARMSLGDLGSAALPGSYSLDQNYPNPFNPSTQVKFTLPTAGRVEMSIFNVLGQKVATIANGFFAAGTHEVTWHGTDQAGNQVSSGVYFYRLNADNFSETKKMMLMK